MTPSPQYLNAADGSDFDFGPSIEPTVEQQLEHLERSKNLLCALRTQRVATAKEAIRRANREFDRDALSLGRRINRLRAQLETDTPTPTQPTPRKPDKGSHDPEWSQEDIDHYYQLRGVNGNK